MFNIKLLWYSIPKSPPPKKNKTNKLDITSMLEYSPKKKEANIKDEYSTLYPATNSASASGKSKGIRFVSAKMEIKKIIAKGNKGKINQVVKDCTSIILRKLKELTKHIIGINIKLIDTS